MAQVLHRRRKAYDDGRALILVAHVHLLEQLGARAARNKEAKRGKGEK